MRRVILYFLFAIPSVAWTSSISSQPVEDLISVFDGPFFKVLGILGMMLGSLFILQLRVVRAAGCIFFGILMINSGELFRLISEPIALPGEGSVSELFMALFLLALLWGIFWVRRFLSSPEDPQDRPMMASAMRPSVIDRAPEPVSLEPVVSVPESEAKQKPRRDVRKVIID